MKDIKTIAFDADDTLWVNEPYFVEAEEKFCLLMQDFAPKEVLSDAVYQTQIKNLPLYGYGIKGYILSMIEAAMLVSQGKMFVQKNTAILNIGKELLQKPVELLDGVEETLTALYGKYKLVVATKGDLKDQHRKLHLSGIGHYFHHIEVMTDKQVIDYQKMTQRLEIDPNAFMMVGNSLKSDVLPVLEINAHAIHIPFHTTWLHEQIDHEITHKNFLTVSHIAEILPILL